MQNREERARRSNLRNFFEENTREGASSSKGRKAHVSSSRMLCLPAVMVFSDMCDFPDLSGTSRSRDCFTKSLPIEKSVRK